MNDQSARFSDGPAPGPTGQDKQRLNAMVAASVRLRVAMAAALCGGQRVVVIAEVAGTAAAGCTQVAGHGEDDGRWPTHSNQLGDWCPWSGETRALDDDPDYCPATCDVHGIEDHDGHE